MPDNRGAGAANGMNSVLRNAVATRSLLAFAGSLLTEYPQHELTVRANLARESAPFVGK